MQYDGLAWAVALLAVLALLVALRILLNTGWFLGWLRGTCGLVFVALAGLVGWHERVGRHVAPAEVVRHQENDVRA